MSLIESGIELSKGMQIFFIGEKAPMTVKAVNEKFAIATRPLHRWYDASLIHHEVNMGAFMSFTEAYKNLQKEIIYTCIDLEKNIRGPHNLIMGGYSFKNQKDIDRLLKDLVSGETEISKRNQGIYNLDFERTLNNLNI